MYLASYKSTMDPGLLTLLEFCDWMKPTSLQALILPSLVPSLSASDFYRLQYEKSIFHTVSDKNLTRGKAGYEATYYHNPDVIGSIRPWYM